MSFAAHATTKYEPLLEADAVPKRSITHVHEFFLSTRSTNSANALAAEDCVPVHRQYIGFVDILLYIGKVCWLHRQSPRTSVKLERKRPPLRLASGSHRRCRRRQTSARILDIAAVDDDWIVATCAYLYRLKQAGLSGRQ